MPMPFTWSAQITQTAVELWNAGKTGGEIAQVIHAPSRDSVTRKIARLRAQGVPIAPRSSSGRPVALSIEPRMFVWTAERVQTAIGLWSAGKTGSEIAQVIHAPSRDSVTRKISRLRRQGVPVQSRPSPIRPRPMTIGAEMPVPASSSIRSDGPVSLIEVGFRQCRYPLWEGQSGPKLVCGKKTLTANSSWCEQHHALIFKGGGTLEKTAVMANHASTRTTQLYDRRKGELSLNEVERILI